jgi:LuxR family maltose regulon positive regulatory protein
MARPNANQTSKAAHLVRSKFSAPPPPRRLVRRDRLLNRLDGAYESSLTLLSAPAGYGKTSLLSDWVRARSRKAARVAWLTLDDADNEPHRFWTYFLASIAALWEGDDAHFLTFSDWQIGDRDVIVTRLGANAARLSSPLAILLDDYHHISNPDIHQTLDYLLEHLPPTMHVVLASRTDPALQIAALRAQGQLNEIRTEDLRFSDEESAAFLHYRMGLDLSPGTAAELAVRFEGWPAGLQLAALSIRSGGSPSPLSPTVGADPYIAEFLAEQVLRLQPASVQEFLVSTSICERLCGPLCEAITGQPNGTATLRSLLSSNLFLVPIDRAHTWYRYHPMFSSFLRGQLPTSNPESLRGLHRRAATWFSEAGLPEESVHHALAAKDYDLAIRGIALVANDLWDRSEIHRMAGWVSAIPGEIVRASSSMSISMAWALALTGRLLDVEPWLQSIEARSLSDPADRLPEGSGDSKILISNIGVLRAFVSQFTDPPERAIATGRKALTTAPSSDYQQRSLAALMLGASLKSDGQDREAREVLTQAYMDAKDAEAPLAVFSAAHALAGLDKLQGDLGAGMRRYQEASEFIAGLGLEPPAGIDLVGTGDILRERNSMAEASLRIVEGVRRAEASSHFVFLAEAYITQARLQFSLRRKREAVSTLRKAERVARLTPTSRLLEFIHAWKARFALAEGNLDEALAWTRDCHINAADQYVPCQEFSHLVLARILCRAERCEEGLLLLTELERGFTESGRQGRLLETLIIKSMALQRRGSIDEAIDVLTQAVCLAAPQRWVQVFIDEGNELERLLRRAAALVDPDARSHRALLLDAFNLLSARPDSFSSVTDRSDQEREVLTAREMQVMRLIAAGLSNEQISAKLVITVGTAKAHVHSILGKLGARSRTEAAALSRSRGLL